MPTAATMTSSPPQPHNNGVASNGSAPAADTDPDPDAATPAVCTCRAVVPAVVARHHEHALAARQCCAVMVHLIEAPADAVWSLVRRFDQPQAYKCFIRSCRIVRGDGVQVGSERELLVVSGLPAAYSHERLEIRDEEGRVISFRILGGDHRLTNYRSVTTVHEAGFRDGRPCTMVVESYMVDVPERNSPEDAHIFIETIVRCNLHSLEQTVTGRQRAMEEEEEEPQNNGNGNDN